MMEDRELIRRTLEGERGAFDEIVARYQDGLFRHLLRLTGRPEEAEDLCQEAFIGLYRSLRRFNSERPLIPFLFTIATNAWKKRLRDAGPEVPMSYETAGSCGDPVAEKVFASLEYQRVLIELMRLQPEQREAVSLFYDQGLSYREISGITGAPVGTVSARLKRGLETLRKALAAGGAGLVIPGMGDLPQYLTSVLQGQATAPATLVPAVAHGISALASGGAGLFAYLKGALVMKKVIYVVIGLAIVGGAAVVGPRLLHRAPRPHKTTVPQTIQDPIRTMPKGLSVDMIVTQPGREAVVRKIYFNGDRWRIEYDDGKIGIMRWDRHCLWMIYPDKRSYGTLILKDLTRDALYPIFDINALTRLIGAKRPTLMGQETIDGYLCDKYFYIPKDHDSADNRTEVWFAKDPGMTIRLERWQNGKIDTTQEFKQIHFGELPDALFEVPAGYTEEK
jgi:RNA polymerase sigma-70 factor, ECF subfamily